MSQNIPSERFPLLSINSCLSQYPAQKFLSDVPLMRIWQPYSHVILDHKLMFSTGIRTIKAQLLQIPNQISTPDWAKVGH